MLLFSKLLYMLTHLTIFYINEAISIISDDFQKENVCQTPEDYDNRTSERCWYLPDVDLTPSQIIKNYGYPFEEYKVTTEDGFYLQLYRIPHGKNNWNTNIKNKQPIFLQHGFLSSSAVWILSGNRSLAFILADNGYDVWLANSRGTTYSQGHVNWTRNSPKYWNWSFHEVGIYDLPASLDKIIEVSGRNDIILITISMGAQIAYIFAVSKPEEASKRIKLMINIGPGMYPGDNELNFYLITQFEQDIQKIADNTGFYEIIHQTPYVRKILENLCFSSSIDYYNCMDILFDFVGENYDQLMPETLPLIIGHHPAGTSLKYVLHLAQNINTNCFCAYDHGEDNNLILYGNETAPEYDISQLKIPAFIIYSKNDKKCNEEAATILFNKIPTTMRTGLFQVNNTSFNHIDLIFGRDVVEEVYSHIIKVVKNLDFN